MQLKKSKTRTNSVKRQNHKAAGRMQNSPQNRLAKNEGRISSSVKEAGLQEDSQQKTPNKMKPEQKGQHLTLTEQSLFLYFRFACNKCCALGRAAKRACLDGHIKSRRISPADCLQFISAWHARLRCAPSRIKCLLILAFC